MNIIRIALSALIVILAGIAALIFGVLFVWCLGKLEIDTRATITRILARMK